MRAQKSLTTARKYLEGEALPRRERLEAVAAWLRVRPEWLVNGVGPRYASEEWERAEDLPQKPLRLPAPGPPYRRTIESRSARGSSWHPLWTRFRRG